MLEIAADMVASVSTSRQNLKLKTTFCPFRLLGAIGPMINVRQFQSLLHCSYDGAKAKQTADFRQRMWFCAKIEARSLLEVASRTEGAQTKKPEVSDSPTPRT